MINTEQNNSTDDIQTLIRQAEIMQTKMRLELQFKKNMEYFKNKVPKMYEKYKNFVPKHQKIFIDDKGYPNILNTENNTATFKSNPAVFAQKQVEHFLESPTRYTMSFRQMASWNDKHLHLKSVNQAFDDYADLDLEKKQKNTEIMSLVIIVGCGLGYQITEAIRNGNIQNIFIYDSNNDSFYASLYSTDWVEIIEHFKDKDGALQISVGEDPFTALAMMRSLQKDIGLFNIIQSFSLIHTKSKDNLFFIESYRTEFHLNGTGVGFFDDEHISFSHTIENSKGKYPIFNPSPKSTLALPPVMIIGNGPSLDMLETFIKDNLNNVILISCGTSIGSLYKMGITPDLHVEMERGLTTAQWITMGTDIEYTKKIPLLALNTVAPKVTELFKSCYISLKPNDIGSKLLQKESSPKKLFELPLCNPTATNCALSYAINIGFSEIYLIGTDYGMKSKDEHHSKNSIYHHIDQNIRKAKEYDKGEGKDYTYSSGQYPRPGNFGGEVLTINSLDLSRKNIEILINETTKEKEIKCFNPNDGALIRGAEPIKHTNIVIKKNNINKVEIIKSIIKNNFSSTFVKKINHKRIKEKYIKNLIKYESFLLLPETCEDIKKLHGELKRVFLNLKNLEKVDDISSILIIGSIQIHFALLYISALKCPDDETFQKIYNIGKKYYNTLIKDILKLMKEDPYRLDDSVRTFE